MAYRSANQSLSVKWRSGSSFVTTGVLPFFVLCVFANVEASQFLPWKREALENCFWDAICNRVSAKYVGTMKCRFPLFFSPVGSGLNSVGFGWFPLGLAGTGEP